MMDVTKDRILAEAESLIAEKGVYGMSIGELAERSQTSKGSVQYYFKTKQGVVDEAAKKSVKSIGDRLLAWVDSLSAKTSPEDALGSLSNALLEDGTALRVFISANSSVVPDSPLEAVLDSALSEWSVMLDVGAMRLEESFAKKMKRVAPAILPFLSGLAALNADPAYAKDALIALIIG